MAQEKETFGLSEDEVQEILWQVRQEKINSETYMDPKWRLWRRRLRLLNNQKKNQADISEPLVHVHFNTIIAALYNDELNTEFLPRSRGDANITDNLNNLYEFDSVVMNKETMDYEWLWNRSFFGRALVMMFEFDREKSVPKPEVVNMMNWYRDPNARSVNGDSGGRGAMRYGGRPILMTDKEMEDAGVYGNIDLIEDSTTDNETLRDTQDKIQSAQGFDNIMPEDITTEARQHTIFEWLTIYKGKRVVVGLANGEGLLVRYNELKDQEQWGIIDGSLYPNSIDWDGVSIMDLIEDKQRFKAKILNSAAFNVEANSNHMYAYDANKIMNESDLDFEINKHIPVDGNPSNVISPIVRNQIGNEVSFLLDYLDVSAGKATGATEVQQGALAGSKRTATEIAAVSESADTRFNLLAKVVSWGEKAFARYWYKMYKLHFMDKIDEKIVRINGANGYNFRSLSRAEIISTVDPDVSVKSKIVGEARRLRKIQEWNATFEILAQDPSVDKDLLVRERAKLGGATQLEMDMLFKPNPESLLAREENEKLSEGEKVKIHETDDDMRHVQEHEKATDTKATQAHIQAHMKQYIVKGKNPNVQDEVAALAEQTQVAPQAGQPIEVGEQNLDAPKILQTA